MKQENFDINRMYTYYINIYPQDNSKYGNKTLELSGLFFADNCHDALEKFYKDLGVEYGKTMCYPNIRHFVTEVIPFMSTDRPYCTGISDFTFLQDKGNSIVMISIGVNSESIYFMGNKHVSGEAWDKTIMLDNYSNIKSFFTWDGNEVPKKPGMYQMLVEWKIEDDANIKQYVKSVTPICLV